MRRLYLLFYFLSGISSIYGQGNNTYIRASQLGYLPGDIKSALCFSREEITSGFQIKDASSGEVVYKSKLKKIPAPGWDDQFSHFYLLDFTELQKWGTYFISTGDIKSKPFDIGDHIFDMYPDIMLEFMRQQRCGYNPFLDLVCHQRDGRMFYAPQPDSTFIDVTGGWHDAGDQLKYLITSSNATAQLLLAYIISPDKFGDKKNGLGQNHPNGIPDILDEAKWGLDWIHKMHPQRGWLFHQIADDRDHIGWKWPDRDSSDYGWGPNSYRVVYFANGQPQGLGRYKSKATGIANLAGRSAAAMALGSRVWKDHLKDTIYAEKCLEAALDLYKMGKKKEGYQQGNSYGAPYRYGEITWADDMEWAASELFKATGEESFLKEAKNYAEIAGSTSWMNLDSMEHYQYYPFINAGHFSLSEIVNDDFKKQLADFYKTNIENILKRSRGNIYGIGIPFIWCSNNLMAAFITQVLFYERMTGDRQFHHLMTIHRDWLLGRNPWGTSMFTGMPPGGEYPQDIHTSVWYLTQKMVRGGLVDGPIQANIYNKLTGVLLTKEDEFSLFQNEKVVYHDDIGDYSTNEPTMDGTAGAILMMASFD